MIRPELNKFSRQDIVDSHVHFRNISFIKETYRFFTKELGIKKLNLLSYAKPRAVNSNPQIICFKAVYPETTYIMGGLDYSQTKGLSDKKIASNLVTQLERLIRIGFDGVKLLETKPTIAKQMPFPIDSPVYDSFFALLEEKRIPILWHVADPEEFWQKDKVPSWAKKSGWDYTDGTFPAKEELYRKVDKILVKYPDLKIIFAHFYFLSADLPRAGKFLDRYNNINFDITPGSEMYFNFSKKVNESRDFFIRYQDRILFGDDTEITEKKIPKKDISQKIYFIRNFLETEKEFYWRSQPVCGIKLPARVLEKIYAKNFFRIVGHRPANLNLGLGIEECHRIGRVLKKEYNYSDRDNFGFQSEKFLQNEIKK